MSVQLVPSQRKNDTCIGNLTAGLRSYGRTGIPVIGVRQIVEDSQVDGEDAHGRTAHPQRRHDVRDARIGGPAKPEQANGHERGFNAGKVQPAFCRGGEEFPS